MKIYIIKHKGKIQRHKLEAWAEIDKVGVRAIKAFTKLKYAKEWVEINNAEHLEIKSVNIF